MILYNDWTPQTVASIERAVAQGTYDDTEFYRVVDDFVLQAGNEAQDDTYPYTSGEGVPLEIREGLDFGSGAVGLARTLRDDGTSHFFIGEKPALHLSRPTGTNDLLADPGPPTAQGAA
jgi:cyclophilin family peptidyl-prolyl cis-trans isomerase